MDWCHCICDNNLLSSACIQLGLYMARLSVNAKKGLRTDKWKLMDVTDMIIHQHHHLSTQVTEDKQCSF